MCIINVNYIITDIVDLLTRKNNYNMTGSISQLYLANLAMMRSQR